MGYLANSHGSEKTTEILQRRVLLMRLSVSMTELMQLSCRHIKLHLSKNTAQREPLSFLSFIVRQAAVGAQNGSGHIAGGASSCEQNAHDSLSTAEVLPSQKSHASLPLSGVVGGSQPPLGRTCPPHRLRTHVHARPTAEQPFERNNLRPRQRSLRCVRLAARTAEEERLAVAVRAGDTHAFRIKRQNARPSQSAASFPPWGNSALLADARVSFLFLRSLPVAIFAQRSIAFKVTALGSCLCVTFEDEQNEVCGSCGLRTTSGGSLAKTSAVVSFATACRVSTVSHVYVCVCLNHDLSNDAVFSGAIA